MHRSLTIAIAFAVLAPSLALASPPTHPVRDAKAGPPAHAKAYGRHCLDAAPAGLRRGTPEFRTYFAACKAAAAKADGAASETETAASAKARGRSACAHTAAFAAPRSTPAKRAAFAACVKAAVAAQREDD